MGMTEVTGVPRGSNTAPYSVSADKCDSSDGGIRTTRIISGSNPNACKSQGPTQPKPCKAERSKGVPWDAGDEGLKTPRILAATESPGRL